MLISLKDAAYFIQANHEVFDELWRRRDEPIGDGDIFPFLEVMSDKGGASPRHVLAQLKALRFLVESDEDSGSWMLARPFVAWMEHLQQYARPISAKIIEARLTDLETKRQAFEVAINRGDIETAKDMLRESNDVLHQINEDLRETRAAIANIVRESKTGAQEISTIERFRRINRLWEEYIEPMVHLLNPTGRFEAICSGWETQIAIAHRGDSLPDRVLSERLERRITHLRPSIREAFRATRAELAPLHNRLRRDSMYAGGAACVLARLEKEGPNAFDNAAPLSIFRYQNHVTRLAIIASANDLDRAIQPPPVIDFLRNPPPPLSNPTEEILDSYVTLPSDSFPIPDLMEHLAGNFAEAHGFHPALEVLSHVANHPRFQVGFDLPVREYQLGGGIVRCGRITLNLSKAHA